MGIVYRALDRRSGHIVALKTVRTPVAEDFLLTQRFQREAEILTRLAHSHIVPVHEVGQTEGRYFLAMAFVAGGSLNRHRHQFLIDHRAAVVVAEKITQAIQHAHELGILHRDLKPANVLLDENGEPLVSDFGLARLDDADPQLTRTGWLVGTPSYMAPEQAGGGTGKVGPATDVWAIGVLLYELVTGCRPFVGDNYRQVLSSVLFEEPISAALVRPDVDTSLEAVVRKCLEKDPGRRYATAAELGADLRRCLKGEPVQASLAQRSPKSGRWAARYAGVAALVGAIAVGLFALNAGGKLPDTSENWRFASFRFEPLSERIAQGRAVEFLGKRDLPVWYRWRMGKTIHVNKDPFSIESSAPSMMDLAPRLPVEGYRLFAEVKAANIALGEAGIYFACAQRENEEGTEHWFYALTVAQTPWQNRIALQLFHCREKDETHKGILDKGMLIEWRLDSPATEEPEWFAIAVEVEPAKIRVFRDGKPIGEIATTDIERSRRMVLPSKSRVHTPLVELSPQGSLGLYVHSGTGAFRNVIVQPLKCTTVIFP